MRAPPPITARSLLTEAAELFDASAALRAAIPRYFKFDGGAAWMRLALGQVRGRALADRHRAFTAYGIAKYGLASITAIAFAALMCRTRWPIGALLGVFVFYAVEAQFVFLFPLLIEGSRRPLRDSLRLTRRAGGTLAVMRAVMRLAITMLFGGFAGGGFVRSWCLGCLAVCIWYECLRGSPGRTRRVTFGASGPLLVRTETLGGFALSRPVRLLYVSDLHLGRSWTNGAAGQVINAARSSDADAILLGGDLLDRLSGAPRLGRLVRALGRIAPVFAVDGNHDRRTGLMDVRRVVIEQGATWLTGPVPLAGVTLTPRAEAGGPGPTVLCTHEPSIFPAAAAAGIDLVLAGHLHGGQCVAWTWATLAYPGAWFSKWTGLRFEQNGSTMLVSRGVADTLPLRWNCPREVILCEIS